MPFAHREIKAEVWAKRHFEGEQFDAVRFFSCGLSRCSFRGCHFFDIAFEACDLSGARFEGCRIARGVFRECDLDRTVWTHCAAERLEWTESSLSHARVSDCLLPGLSVHASALNGTRFEDAMLEGMRMVGVLGPGVRFTRSNLLEAVLEGCRFRGGEFSGGLWDRSRMDDCDLLRASLSEIRAAGIAWQRLLLEKASFHEVSLSGRVEAADVNPAVEGLVYILDGSRDGDPALGRRPR